jgi:hypothetical protein
MRKQVRPPEGGRYNVNGRTAGRWIDWFAFGTDRFICGGVAITTTEQAHDEGRRSSWLPERVVSSANLSPECGDLLVFRHVKPKNWREELREAKALARYLYVGALRNSGQAETPTP